MFNNYEKKIVKTYLLKKISLTQRSHTFGEAAIRLDVLVEMSSRCTLESFINLRAGPLHRGGRR